MKKPLQAAVEAGDARDAYLAGCALVLVVVPAATADPFGSSTLSPAQTKCAPPDGPTFDALAPVELAARRLAGRLPGPGGDVAAHRAAAEHAADLAARGPERAVRAACALAEGTNAAGGA